MYYNIKHIGHLSDTLLKTEKSLKFWGQTSKGIFLKSDTNKILFLSFELFTGPYTLNIQRPFENFPLISRTEHIAIDKKNIIFKNAKIQICFEQSKIWTPNKIERILPKSKIKKNLQEAITTLLPLASKASLFPYAQSIVEQKPLLTTNLPLNKAQIENVQHALIKKKEEDLLSTLTACIGFGNGLTPSGDDFVCGILLVLTQLNDHYYAGKSFTSSFKHQLIKSALRKTTMISANLIEAALLSSADQRILNALNKICADTPSHADAIKNLTSWGNSSGQDIFVGITLALSS